MDELQFQVGVRLVNVAVVKIFRDNQCLAWLDWKAASVFAFDGKMSAKDMEDFVVYVVVYVFAP